MWHPPIGLTLLVIAGALGTAAMTSIRAERRERERERDAERPARRGGAPPRPATQTD